MRAAEFALDSGRRQSGKRVSIYTKELQSLCIDWKSMLEKLPNAIANGELAVYFQPKIHISDRRIVGFEALVRWTCDGKSVLPTELIRLAEQSGLIAELDLFVLQKAVEYVADWNRRHRTTFSVSSNLSTIHLTASKTFDTIVDCLQRYGLSPELLTVEITENVELANDEITQSTLERLQAHGCRVSVDDFGTGYSSFSYLRGFDTDELKIDRSFLSDIVTSATARDVLGAVLGLARTLGRAVIVEGVETKEQEAILIDLGAEQLQGFLYGKPRPAIEWLADATYSRARKPEETKASLVS